MADNDERQREEELIRQINRCIAENNMLREELEAAIHNVRNLTDNVDSLAQVVVQDISALGKQTVVLNENVTVVKDELADLTHRYFFFKNLSTASKNLTQCTD